MPLSESGAAHTSSPVGSAALSFRDCCRISQAIGMDLGAGETRGLAFTIAAGQLNNGQRAEGWIAEMNGWPVEDIAREALNRGAVKRISRSDWEWALI